MIPLTEGEIVSCFNMASESIAAEIKFEPETSPILIPVLSLELAIEKLRGAEIGSLEQMFNRPNQCLFKEINFTATSFPKTFSHEQTAM